MLREKREKLKEWAEREGTTQALTIRDGFEQAARGIGVLGCYGLDTEALGRELDNLLDRLK